MVVVVVAGAWVVLGADRVVEVVAGAAVVAVEDRPAGAGDGEEATAGAAGTGATVVVGPSIVSGG